jgi:hypothetical protein
VSTPHRRDAGATKFQMAGGVHPCILTLSLELWVTENRRPKTVF